MSLYISVHYYFTYYFAFAYAIIFKANKCPNNFKILYIPR